MRRRRFNRPQLSRERAAEYGVKLPKQSRGRGAYLSPTQVGRMLNVTAEAVKQWIYLRRLSAVKLANGYWQIRVSDLQKYLAAKEKGTPWRRRVLYATAHPGLTQLAERNALYEPIFCQNLADALLKASEAAPALAVIDLSAKACEPWRLAEKLREIKSLKNCPILLVGDDLTETELNRAVEFKAAGLVSGRDIAMIAAEIKRVIE